MNCSENMYRSECETGGSLKYVKGFMMVVTMLAGLVTNSLSSVVWLTQVKTKTAALFIGCLSLADAFYCLALPLSNLVMPKVNIGQCARLMETEVLLICAEASRMLTIAVVAQRWVSVSRPLSMTRLCTLQRRLIVLACLFLPIIAIHFFDFYVIWFGEINCSSCDFESRMEHFLQAYRILNLTFSLLCFVCMFTFSVPLLISTCNIPQVTPSLRSRRWQRDLELRLTVTILCVSAISLVEFALSIIYILEILEFDLEGVNRCAVLDVFIFVTLIIRPVNFVVYSCIGKDFRSRLRSMCKCKMPINFLGRQRESSMCHSLPSLDPHLPH